MTFKIKYLGTLILFFALSFLLSAQEGEVNVSQDSAIDKLLEYKKDTKTTKIYKIQVFQSVDPDKAQRERANFLNSFGQWPIEIVWNTPNYKVWVGKFATQLEVDRALQKIKRKYMYAFPVQPKSNK